MISDKSKNQSILSCMCVCILAVSIAQFLVFEYYRPIKRSQGS